MSSTLTPSETVYVIESDAWTGNDDEGNPVFTLSLPAVINEHLIAAVERLEREFDTLTCESLACQRQAQDASPNPVGWGLHEREGSYGEEITYSDFMYTAVVVTPTGAWLMCEDCHCAEEFSPGGAAHQRLKEGAQ